MNKIKLIMSFLILSIISSCNSTESNNQGLYAIANSINQLSESIEKISIKKDNISINAKDEFIYIKNVDFYCRRNPPKNIILNRSSIESMHEGIGKSSGKNIIYIKVKNLNPEHCIYGKLEDWDKHFKIIK